jgi:hypothetical protein
VLGFKEPVFWPVQSWVAPYHVDGFLKRFSTKYVFMFRHPYDNHAYGRKNEPTRTTPPRPITRLDGPRRRLFGVQLGVESAGAQLGGGGHRVGTPLIAGNHHEDIAGTAEAGL